MGFVLLFYDLIPVHRSLVYGYFKVKGSLMRNTCFQHPT